MAVPLDDTLIIDPDSASELAAEFVRAARELRDQIWAISSQLHLADQHLGSDLATDIIHRLQQVQGWASFRGITLQRRLDGILRAERIFLDLVGQPLALDTNTVLDLLGPGVFALADLAAAHDLLTLLVGDDASPSEAAAVLTGLGDQVVADWVTQAGTAVQSGNNADIELGTEVLGQLAALFALSFQTPQHTPSQHQHFWELPWWPDLPFEVRVRLAGTGLLPATTTAALAEEWFLHANPLDDPNSSHPGSLWTIADAEAFLLMLQDPEVANIVLLGPVGQHLIPFPIPLQEGMPLFATVPAHIEVLLAQALHAGLVKFPASSPTSTPATYTFVTEALLPHIEQTNLSDPVAEALAMVAVHYLPALVGGDWPFELQSTNFALLPPVAPQWLAGAFSKLQNHEGAKQILHAGAAANTAVLLEWSVSEGGDEPNLGAASVAATAIAAMYDLLFAGLDFDGSDPPDMLWWLAGLGLDKITEAPTTANSHTKTNWALAAVSVLGALLMEYQGQMADEEKKSVSTYIELTASSGQAAGDTSLPAVSTVECIVAMAVAKQMGEAVPDEVTNTTNPAVFAAAYQRWKQQWSAAFQKQVAAHTLLTEQQIESAARS